MNAEIKKARRVNALVGVATVVVYVALAVIERLVR